MREPRRRLCGAGIELVGNNLVTVDLEDRSPLGSAGSPRNFHDRIANIVEAGLGHVVGNRVDNSLLAQVKGHRVARVGPMVVLVRGGHVAVKELCGLEGAHGTGLAHKRGLGLSRIACREALECHLGIPRGANAYKASSNRRCGGIVLGPLERVLRVHERGTRGDSALTSVDGHAVAHGAQIDSQEGAAGKGNGPVGERHGAVLRGSRERHALYVGADGTQVGGRAL